MTAGLALRPLDTGDVTTLAALHRVAFPDFFLSSLGEPFLTQFYRGFLQDDTAVTTVALGEDARILGAVVGTTEPAGFFRRLLKNRFWGFALASAGAALRHPPSAPRLIRAVTYRGDARTAQGALLSSICVDPQAQGTGVGHALLTSWETRAREHGAESAFLTTDALDNEAVNRFYLSAGWSLHETFETRQGRRMNFYTKRLVEDPC